MLRASPRDSVLAMSGSDESPSAFVRDPFVCNELGGARSVRAAPSPLSAADGRRSEASPLSAPVVP